MSQPCPIPDCRAEVSGPLRLCRAHFCIVPPPIQAALASFARAHKGGPAHRASFARAVESIEKTIEFQRKHLVTVAPATPISTPYKDD
jgi:hypothetical protein